MAQKFISGRRELTKIFVDRVKELLYKPIKSDWRWFFWVVRSDWSKKWHFSDFKVPPAWKEGV